MVKKLIIRDKKVEKKLTKRVEKNSSPKKVCLIKKIVFKKTHKTKRVQKSRIKKSQINRKKSAKYRKIQNYKKQLREKETIDRHKVKKLLKKYRIIYQLIR